jgi:hypothetical protein
MKSIRILIIAYAVILIGMALFVLYCLSCAPTGTGNKWIYGGKEPCPSGRVCDTLPGTHVKPDTVKPVEW